MKNICRTIIVFTIAAAACACGQNGGKTAKEAEAAVQAPPQARLVSGLNVVYGEDIVKKL